MAGTSFFNTSVPLSGWGLVFLGGSLTLRLETVEDHAPLTSSRVGSFFWSQCQSFRKHPVVQINIRDRGGGLTRQCLIAPRRCLESQCCTEEKELEGIWCLDSAYAGDRGGKTPRQGRISLDQIWLICWFYSALALPTFNLTLLSTALPWQGLLVSPWHLTRHTSFGGFETQPALSPASSGCLWLSCLLKPVHRHSFILYSLLTILSITMYCLPSVCQMCWVLECTWNVT